MEILVLFLEHLAMRSLAFMNMGSLEALTVMSMVVLGLLGPCLAL